MVTRRLEEWTMAKLDGVCARAIFSLFLIAGLFYMPPPAFSQDDTEFQNVVVNGGFEAGFQEGFGVGYGWGAFSNGNATVGWNGDTWDKVVAAGKHAQMIEIGNAAEMNRYAGIYQTVTVVPDRQYRLTIQGLIRSTEGDINLSDYGYRLQYGLDYDGGTAWELLGDDAWVELPWDEQPLQAPAGGLYRLEKFETTITARSNKLTLFIRGWKKWVNNGSAIFDLDEISLVGPAPDGFEMPAGQVAAAASPATPAGDPSGAEMAVPDAPPRPESALPDAPAQPETASPETTAPLPVSGRGPDESITYIVFSGAALLLVLLVGALTATLKQRNPQE